MLNRLGIAHQCDRRTSRQNCFIVTALEIKLFAQEKSGTTDINYNWFIFVAILYTGVLD